MITDKVKKFHPHPDAPTMYEYNLYVLSYIRADVGCKVKFEHEK